jgi:3D (Asp-Asp-Asp) domain-containing protein
MPIRLLFRFARTLAHAIRSWRVALALVPAAAAACQSADTVLVDAPAVSAPVLTAPVAVPHVTIVAAAATPKAYEAPAPVALGQFQMTFYYLIVEGEVHSRHKPSGVAAALADDATLAAVAPATPDPDDDRVTIYEGKSCASLAEVSRRYAAELTLQGSGQLNDGRVLNVWGNCSCPRSPCFQVTAGDQSKWGLAGTGRALSPFRTVAVDPKVVPLGTLLYIPELDGLRMPGRAPIGGFIHDGCVVADDTGGGVKGKQVDLFVGRKAYWQGLARRGGSHAWARHITIYPGAGKCTRAGGRVSRSAAAGI